MDWVHEAHFVFAAYVGAFWGSLPEIHITCQLATGVLCIYSPFCCQISPWRTDKQGKNCDNCQCVKKTKMRDLHWKNWMKLSFTEKCRSANFSLSSRTWHPWHSSLFMADYHFFTFQISKHFQGSLGCIAYSSWMNYGTFLLHTDNAKRLDLQCASVCRGLMSKGVRLIIHFIQFTDYN